VSWNAREPVGHQEVTRGVLDRDHAGRACLEQLVEEPRVCAVDPGADRLAEVVQRLTEMLRAQPERDDLRMVVESRQADRLGVRRLGIVEIGCRAVASWLDADAHADQLDAPPVYRGSRGGSGSRTY
jgi:hypothetical protein